MPVAITLIGFNSPMRALADPIGECVVDEARFKGRLDDRAERVVNNTIAERRRRNDASLRIVDFEGGVAARPIVACAKLALQSEQLTLQIGEERAAPGFLRFPLMARCAASAPRPQAPCVWNCLPLNHALKRVDQGLRPWTPRGNQLFARIANFQALYPGRS